MTLVKQIGELRRRGQRFRGGDPYPATGFNAVVLQSAAANRDWAREHWPSGEHRHPRIPVAGGLIRWKPGGWDWGMAEGVEKVQAIGPGELLVTLEHELSDEQAVVPIVIPLGSDGAGTVAAVSAGELHVRLSSDGPAKPWSGDFLLWVWGLEAPRQRQAPPGVIPSPYWTGGTAYPMPHVLRPGSPLPAELATEAHGAVDRFASFLGRAHVGEGRDAGTHDTPDVALSVCRFELPIGDDVRQSGTGRALYAHGFTEAPRWEYRSRPDRDAPEGPFGYRLRARLPSPMAGGWLTCIADGWPSAPGSAFGTNLEVRVAPGADPRDVVIHLEHDTWDADDVPRVPANIQRIRSVCFAIWGTENG